MVIGNGLIATKFSSYSNNDEIIIFASGVSNSKDATENDFKREFNLLKNTVEKYQYKLLVYFSTCSIYDADENTSPYVLHKLNIENYIKTNALKFYIFRVSNLVGSSGNSKTVLNYFYAQIKSGNHFYVWKNAKRNLIDIDDMKKIIDYIIENAYKKNSIINIANPQSTNVLEIIKALEKTTNLKAAFTPVNKGSDFVIDINDITSIMSILKIKFDADYLPNLIKKYFG